MKKIKKIVAAMLATMMAASAMCVSVGAITIYAPDGRTEWVSESNLHFWTSAGWSTEPFITVYAGDGRTLVIPQSKIAEYEKVGWYTEPVVTLYSMDGREITVPNFQVAAYESVGWYKPVTMYSEDGRTANVKVFDVEAWKAVGWYTEPVMTVSSEDGRDLVIPKAQLEAYKSVGWFEPVTMYAPDGRQEKVKVYNIKAWENVGWSTKPFVKVYAPDGKVKSVTEKEVKKYIAAGWYKDGTSVTVYHSNGSSKSISASDIARFIENGWSTEPFITVYAADGRSLVIPKSQLEAYKKVGWQATKPAPNVRKPRVNYASRNRWTNYGISQLCDKIFYSSDYSDKIFNESVKMYSAVSNDKWDAYITHFNNAKNYAKTTAELFYEAYLYSCNYVDVRIYTYEYAKTYPNIAKCETLQDLLYYLYIINVELSNATIPDSNEELIYFYNLILEGNEARIKLLEIFYDLL